MFYKNEYIVYFQINWMRFRRNFILQLLDTLIFLGIHEWWFSTIFNSTFAFLYNLFKLKTKTSDLKWEGFKFLQKITLF